VAGGLTPHPVGNRLAPPKTIVVVSPHLVVDDAAWRPIEVRLGAAMLAAPCLVLVPFAPDPSLAWP
jgi:hypothetical protein